MGQRIIPLSECPQFADVCAAWAFGQWGSQHGGSLERTQQRFAQCSRPSDDHLTLMMIDGDRPVGMASLWPSDDHQRQDLTRGWPASSCIPITAARALPTAWRWRSSKRRGSHHSILHLITDKSEALYAGWGWQPLERRRQYDEDVVVMVKTL